MNIAPWRRVRHSWWVLAVLTLSLCLADCTKNTEPLSPDSGAIEPSSSDLGPTADTPLTASDVDTVRQLVEPSLIASQQDTFGRTVLEQSTFQVTVDGSTAVVRLEGIPQILISCNGEISSSDGSQMPYSMAAVVEFGAYEIANLSPSLFSRVTAVKALQLSFVANISNKYGHPEERQFLKSVITRDQASKMDWDWFKGAVLRGTFDPSAFDEFDIFFGDPQTAQDMGVVLRILRDSSDQASEALRPQEVAQRLQPRFQLRVGKSRKAPEVAPVGAPQLCQRV
jgi:hypothetical protein